MFSAVLDTLTARLSRPRFSFIASMLTLAISAPTQAADETALLAEFDPSFFRGLSGQDADLSRFSRGNTLSPGSYRFDVYVNQQWIGRQDITVTHTVPEAAVQYCFTPAQVLQWGLDATKLPEAAQAQKALKGEACFAVETFIPNVQVSANTGELMMDITVPQAYLSSRRGVVAPELWDNGVTAGFVGYNVNTYNTRPRQGENTTQYFAGLNSGINLDAWRLRHNGSYVLSRGGQSGGNSGQYRAISTYAQRAVAPLKAQLTVGQYFTPSDQFDSIPFTGVQLASDSRMNTDTENGFAPIIRGFANSNAKVTVRQGNNVIYETTVPPGPFAIDDLQSTGYSGDLQVTVTEADGQTRTFTEAYSSLPQLLRPGISRFNLSAGNYRDSNLDTTPGFLLGTWQQGISNRVTAYTGGIAADKYQSLQGGLAFNTGFGALAVDVTQSRATGLNGNTNGIDEQMQGQSYRATFSKVVPETGTNFTLAATRFSSEGYLSLGDFVQANNAAEPRFNEVENTNGMINTSGLFSALNASTRPRSRFQMNINQTLGEGYGNLFFNGSAQNYWHSGGGTNTTFQAGYGNSYQWGNINVGVSRSKNSTGQADMQYNASVSIPLGNQPRSPVLTTSLNYSDKKNSSVQTTLSGTAGDNSQFSYTAYGSNSQTNSNNNNTVGGSVQYNAPYSVISAGASSSNQSQQMNLGLSGSVVAHPGGVNLTQYQGETMAVVQAKGAEGAAISTNVGAAIQANGYGVVSGLMAFRQNEIALDPKGTSQNVEILGSSQKVAPSYGAITMLKYETDTGVPVLLQAKRSDGQSVPVGSEVQDDKGQYLAMVGQGDLIFIRGLTPQGQLTVKWGSEPEQRCIMNYRLTAKQAELKNYPKLVTDCVMP